MPFTVSVSAAELHLCNARRHRILNKLRTRGLGVYLAMLDHVETSQAAATVEDICRHTTMHRSTVHRGIIEIERVGLVERALVPEDRGAAYSLSSMRWARPLGK